MALTDIVGAMTFPSPDPNLSTADVLAALHASGKPLHEWGRAVEGTALLAAQTGGDKLPPIFITAGSHAPETAGVHAALNLLRSLETEHVAYVLPLRDPLGFSGVNGSLGFAARRPLTLPDYGAALEFLKANGRLLWQ